jgi:hypothetical protein
MIGSCGEGIFSADVLSSALPLRHMWRHDLKGTLAIALPLLEHSIIIPNSSVLSAASLGVLFTSVDVGLVT